MKKYKSHPHLPDWIIAMNGELLSPPELDVLDFIGWCKKHGCRTSNDRIGRIRHHSHGTVQRAIARIYELNLVTIDNYGKRTRAIKAITWPDRQAWENREKNPISDKTYPARRPAKNSRQESLRLKRRRALRFRGARRIPHLLQTTSSEGKKPSSKSPKWEPETSSWTSATPKKK